MLRLPSERPLQIRSVILKKKQARAKNNRRKPDRFRRPGIPGLPQAGRSGGRPSGSRLCAAGRKFSRTGPLLRVGVARSGWLGVSRFRRLGPEPWTNSGSSRPTSSGRSLGGWYFDLREVLQL